MRETDQITVKALLVTAVASGQGKTSVTAALARKLVRQGQRVRVFKCGPDFIDPMILERASGAAVQSLDLWLVGTDACRRLLAEAATEADVILIEGVMGLYDGAPSSADLARAFGIPVLAVIDASAMAQTAGALAQGLRDYGPVALAGIAANRIASSAHAAMVAASLRDIALLATLPGQAISLPERHLGLVVPGELSMIDSVLDTLAEQLVFNSAAWQALPPVRLPVPAAAAALPPLLAGRTIAVARDAAFLFIYPANLATLQALGAKLCFFSPLANDGVPDGADAVYLPGGYPELHAATLAAAHHWRSSIRAAHAAGVPILAECGGMMALADTLSDLDGACWPMAAILPGSVSMQTRLAGLGSQALPTAQGPLRGHTFHYSTLTTSVPPVAHTLKQTTSGADVRAEVRGEACYRIGSLTASYFHAYFPSNPQAVAALLLPVAPNAPT